MSSGRAGACGVMLWLPRTGIKGLWTLSTQRTITATVTALDRSTRAVTYVGPGEFHYSRRVSDSTNLEEFNVGDRIDVTWTEAVQLVVNP